MAEVKSKSEFYNQQRKVVITRDDLNIDEGLRFVKTTKCGAVSMFMGVIRDADNDPSRCNKLFPIQGIEYEIYTQKAISDIDDILREELSNGSGDDLNCKAYVSLRDGMVRVGEVAIMILISSIRRDLSQRAVQSTLRRIKESVPIWKKIIFDEDHQFWADQSKSEAFWLKKL